jgi:hypothetical protein
MCRCSLSLYMGIHNAVLLIDAFPMQPSFCTDHQKPTKKYSAIITPYNLEIAVIPQLPTKCNKDQKFDQFGQIRSREHLS